MKQSSSKKLWNFMDHVAGDKVVWIIALMLMLLSIVFIFSSSSRLTTETTSRLDIVKDQLMVVGLGLVFIIGIYQIRDLEIFRKLSVLGFPLSFVLLLILNMGGIGSIQAPNINGAVRFLKIGGFQIHIFEVVKVAMVMHIAWAVDKLQKGDFPLLDSLSKVKHLHWLKTLWAKKVILIYLPLAIVMAMVMKGSNTAAMFIALILGITMVVGTGDWKEIIILALIVIGLLGGILGIYSISKSHGDKPVKFERIGTGISRMMPHDYVKDYKMATNPHDRQMALDRLRQPYSATIAIHQGVGLGKGPGQSTQRYVVPDMPEDYMFSFIVEEYGFFGGLLVMVLYLSLLARGVIIVKSCGTNLFAQCAIFGLVLLISGQAFIHMIVNCNFGLLTGQTLPMLSHGAFAFVCFSIAFGIILSISRISSRKVEQLTRKAEPLVDIISELEDQLDNPEGYDGI